MASLDADADPGAVTAEVDLDQRALVCFGKQRDGVLVEEMLQKVTIESCARRDLSSLLDEAAQGVGCFIIGEEVVGTRSGSRLRAFLEEQPNWSDVPVIVVAPRRGNFHPNQAEILRLQNVSILESPVGLTSFSSTVRAALAGRRRQLALRGFIADRERAIRQRDDALLALARSQKQLLAESQKKDEFLATLAHELRNPLAPIQNSVAIMSYVGWLHPKVEWARGIIERQVIALSRLIDDLLDVSRLRSGKVELQREVCRTVDVVNAAVETSLPVINAAGLTFRLAPIDPELMFTVDPLRISQAVSNLINNAAKFTRAPGTIEVAAVERDGHVVVSVRDSGVGIAREDLERIFDLFSQVRTPGVTYNSGLGIGLSLVRSFAELHGGRAVALSDGPGRGTEIQIILPALSRADAAPVPPQGAGTVVAEAPVGASSGRLRVLIVDDNRDAAESLQLFLEMREDDTRLAFDGASAIAGAHAFRPHVIVMDLGLPGVDGFDAGRAIRAQHPNCVMVAASGWGRDEDRLRTAEVGFNHHLVKPLDLDQLALVLDDLRAQLT